ncbi:MAG TPA: Chromate resistance protein ChrB [Trebonia sp.]|nr:Chromate resistance protein ChrB [Trebonia sp.]
MTTDQGADRADGPGPGDGPGWLLLIYRVPPEPTRLRSTVWRRIKSLGAIYLQNSVAALPASTANERALRKLRHEITDMSGTAMLMSVSVLAGEPEVLAMFQAARNDEYEEIVDKCQDFLGQVQKEYDENHFTYAELEENEVDLVKLRSWFAKIVERDVFGASGRTACEQSLDKCEQSFEAYAARVYAEEAEGQ